MSKVEPKDETAPSFEVEITSGGRAYDVEAPARSEPASLSPARAAAKERKRQRLLYGSIAVLFVLIVLGAWAYFSNPTNNIPDNALARVNGQFIYQDDVNRDLDLDRAIMDLRTDITGTATLPSAPSVLEDLITRKLRVQDATKAGITASQQEIDAALRASLQSRNIAQQQMEQALAKYGRTLDDLKAFIADTVITTKYIETRVAQGAATNQERQNKINDWETTLAQNAKIDRYKPAGSGPAPNVGAEAPDFTLKDLTGKEVKLSSLRGKPVMINFWATWCPPCRAEIPIIADLYNGTPAASRPYEILGVATQSDLDTVQAFANEFKMNFPVLADDSSQVTGLYHVLPIPTSFFIDKDGIIRYMQVGPVDRPLMEKWLLGK